MINDTGRDNLTEEFLSLLAHPEGSLGAVKPPNSVPTGERSNTPEAFALGAMAYVQELPEYTRKSRELAIAALNSTVDKPL